MLSIGSAICTTGIALFYLLDVDTNYGTVAGYQIVFGVGIGMIMSITPVTVQNSVTPAQMAVAMASFGFFSLLGGALGIAVLGALMNKYIIENLAAGMAPKKAICDAIGLMFLVTLVPGCCVFICSLFVRSVKHAVTESTHNDSSDNKSENKNSHDNTKPVAA